MGLAWVLVMEEIIRKSRQTHWRVRDRTRLLLFLINELAGAAHISLEGSLPAAILEFPGSSAMESGILPLKVGLVSDIVRAVGGTISRSILHIQIEKDGKFAFAAYDNFHPECIYFGESISADLIERLIANKTLACA